MVALFAENFKKEKKKKKKLGLPYSGILKIYNAYVCPIFPSVDLLWSYYMYAICIRQEFGRTIHDLLLDLRFLYFICMKKSKPILLKFIV